MRNVSEITKDNLNATCRTVARRTGQPYAVVKQDDGQSLILEKKLVKETDQIVFEHSGRI